MKAKTERPKKVCETCGADYHRHPRDSEAQWLSRQYCSISCRNKSSDFTPIHIRFWRKVERRSVNECWLWTGSTDSRGYGRLSSGSGASPIKAHRLSYELANGEIPADLVIRHKCDNPSCVNPDHLELGTQKDNARDTSARGRLNKQSLLNLHPGAPGFHGAGPKSQGELHGSRY